MSVREFLATPSREFYAEVDMRLAGRVAAALFVLAVAYAGVIWTAYPPTAAIGPSGWLVAAGVVVYVAFTTALAALRKLSPTQILVLSYFAALGVGVAQWLSGMQAPFCQLLLIVSVYAAWVHPPRRVVPLLAFLVAVGAAPLVYEGWMWTQAAMLIGCALLWTGIAAVATFWTARERGLTRALRLERDRAAQLARTDALTGLGNRHALAERLGDTPVGQMGILLVDLKNFKEVNERHGHQAGDWLLGSVAEELRKAVRRVDACYRWGGDEFLVVIPGANEHVCAEVAARVTERVSRCRKPDGRPLGVAIGEAEADEGDTLDDLIARADRRLLLSKAAG